MAKKSESYSVSVQKGPVRCDETDSLAFYREGPTARDMHELALRRSCMTLTKHEPKR